MTSADAYGSRPDLLPGGISFTGATLVTMADGTKKPIREIKVGDKVLATAPATGQFTYTIDLNPGDQVRETDGTPLTVQTTRTYYAGTPPIFVHNTRVTEASGVGSSGTASTGQAVELGSQHVGGTGEMVRSGSGDWQFMARSTDEGGSVPTLIARFDVNPDRAHVQQLGPHLNLETQTNGRTILSAPLEDPHISIDSTIIRPDDVP